MIPTSQHDYLDQDPDIRGQKFVCISFISPEDVIKQKETWILEQFMSAATKELAELWNVMMEKYKDADLDFVESLRAIQAKHDYLFDENRIGDAYKYYKNSNRDTLESTYLEKNNFQTTLRGFKVRGSYETLKEAQIRAEVLKRKDTNHNVFIAEVGCWCPFSPDPSEIENQEFAETQLNTLMKGYIDNQQHKDEFYEQRKESLRKQADEINETRKQKVKEELASQLAEAEDPWMRRQAEGAAADAGAAATDAGAAATDAGAAATDAGAAADEETETEAI
jgi:hypothetical protein